MRAVNIFASLIMIAMLVVAAVSVSGQASVRQETVMPAPAIGQQLPGAD